MSVKPKLFKAKIGQAIGMPNGADSLWYPQGWMENAGKINVVAYDDPNHACLASVFDIDLFNQLKATGHVTELTEAEFNSEVSRLRPPPPDVSVTLREKASAAETDIIALLKAKKLTYNIEKTATVSPAPIEK